MRVVVVVASAGAVAGEKEQVEMVGGGLVTVIDAVEEAEREPVSVAVTGIE